MAPLSTEPQVRRFQTLALATGIATYLLVVLGGVVKAYGAGLACPDWPLCYGKVVPAFDFGIVLEWGHRLGAVIVSLMTLATTALGWRLRARMPHVAGGLTAALTLLAVQVVLGGVTVFMKNAAVATSAHLGVAMAFLAVWVYLGFPRAALVPGASSLQALTTTTATFAAALMVLGSYLKSAGGGLACFDWPLCQGAVIPAFNHPLVALHWAHRAGALLLGGLILASVVAARRAYGFDSGVARSLALGAGLYLVQVALGAWAVLDLLVPPVVALHLAVAAALFGCLVIAAVLARGEGRPPLQQPNLPGPQ